MFKKILVANRGEIAVRIIRACKEWGISTVAVHSDVDNDSMHVRLADESICIGGHQPQNSYLNIASLMSAADVTGAEAIHPGYGFLSENAKFAEIVTKHGLKFIGPSSDLIEKMGDKIQARKIAKENGLPVIEGSEGDINSIEEAKKISEKIGFPVLIKAAGGGGGKGMKVANNPEESAPLADDLYEYLIEERIYPDRILPRYEDGVGWEDRHYFEAAFAIGEVAKRFDFLSIELRTEMFEKRVEYLKSLLKSDDLESVQRAKFCLGLAYENRANELEVEGYGGVVKEAIETYNSVEEILDGDNMYFSMSKINAAHYLWEIAEEINKSKGDNDLVVALRERAINTNLEIQIKHDGYQFLMARNNLAWDYMTLAIEAKREGERKDFFAKVLAMNDDVLHAYQDVVDLGTDIVAVMEQGGPQALEELFDKQPKLIRDFYFGNPSGCNEQVRMAMLAKANFVLQISAANSELFDDGCVNQALIGEITNLYYRAVQQHRHDQFNINKENDGLLVDVKQYLSLLPDDVGSGSEEWDYLWSYVKGCEEVFQDLEYCRMSSKRWGKIFSRLNGWKEEYLMLGLDDLAERVGSVIEEYEAMARLW